MEKVENIVVIGGVAAGPKVAAKVRRQDPTANITLLTEEEYLSYSICNLPYFIGDIVKNPKELLVREPAYFKNIFNIDTLLRHRAIKIDTAKKEVKVLDLETQKEKSFPYDKLILATGASPIRPPIKGIEFQNIFTFRTIPDAIKIKSAAEQAQRAVVVGGGLIGLEVAENLAKRGLETTVIEKLDQILPPLDRDMALLVEKHIKAKGVDVSTSDGVESFEGKRDGKVYIVNTGKRKISAELVVMSVGVRPNVQLAKEAGIELGTTGAIKVNERMETTVPDVYAAGDCAETINLVTGNTAWIPLATTAAKQGRVAAINATGGYDSFKGVVGTLVVRVFDLNVAKAGLSEKEALREGFKPETTIAVGPDKSLDSKEIMVKLIADKTSGCLLGAQIIGQGNVDKRIDVVATALNFGATVEQLSKLDLAYAPQYGTAMDPLITSANVLRNKLAGETVGISAEQVKAKLERREDFILLDVRSPREYQEARIEGCRHIHIYELAKKTGELDSQKEVVTYCGSGLRAALACRILKNANFKDVKYMDGSLKAWPYELKV
ncbi:MAG TPA: FAD-dependent oxidoreductase [Candidatus Hypogeohydataceae bacterium YC40]